MNLWIIATIISTLFGWTSSMFMKKVSKDFDDNYLALIFQYIAVTIAAVSLGAIWAVYHGTPFFPTLSWTGWLMVLVVWIIWYIGIALLFKAYDHLSAGVALVIANLATFLMYFINLVLYPGQEAFSFPKILVAVIFFIIIAQFLLDQWWHHPLKKKKIINKYTLYPLGTAVCRAIYFVGNGYFIKSGMMSPVQSGMITESTILVVAVVWYLLLHWHKSLKKAKHCMWNARRPFIIIWFLNVISVYLMYYGYETNSANIVNVIRLCGTPITAIMCRLFLKEDLSKKQSILLGAAFMMMVVFLFVK